MAGQCGFYASAASGYGGPLIMTMLVVLWLSPGSLADTDCSSVILPLLTGCASFIASSTATPDSKCCDPLKTVLADSDDAQCLCSLQSGAGSSASSESTQRALGLPKACNITTSFSPSSCTNTTDCHTVTAQVLTVCASFIASNASTPDSKCCDPLKTVLADTDRTSAVCLCLLKTAEDSVPTKRALSVPKACNSSTSFDPNSCTNRTSTGANDKSSSASLVFALSTSFALFGALA